MGMQSSSVASERIFSSGKHTDRPTRTRISPQLFEYLQIIKFAVKKERTHFRRDELYALDDLIRDQVPDSEGSAGTSNTLAAADSQSLLVEALSFIDDDDDSEDIDIDWT